MPFRRSKLLTLAVALLIVAVIGLSGVVALTRVFAASDRPSTPASVFHPVPATPVDLTVSLNWLPETGDTGRPIQQAERDEIRAAYLRAWAQWNRSLLAGRDLDLAGSFSGPALDGLSDALTSTRTDQRIEQADTSHTLELHLYSADGTVASFTDHDISLAQVISDEAGNTILANELRVTYDVVMTLRDGVWTVQNWVRTDAVPLEAVPPAQAAPGLVARSGTQLLVDGQRFEMAGINYYPQATPWNRFWAEYDPAIIDADFARIRELGLNTIRIFVPFAQFGGAYPDPAYLDKLDDLLQRAGAHELKVVVTLFDFRVDYRLQTWAEADRHLAGLIPRFNGNSVILAWDIKNEPDRDYGTGRARVDAWLVHTARVVRTLDPGHLITIGWSTAEAAQALPRAGDFLSFHFYAPANQLADAYASLRAAAPDRPIVLGEFGLPTWNSFFYPYGHTEPEQTAYYADILRAMRETDSSGYLAWTLYDFPSVPDGVAGGFPWQLGPQKQLGIIRLDGTAKPAATLLAPDASLDVPKVSPLARYLKPFWVTFYLVIITSVLVVIVGARHWHAWRDRLRSQAGAGSRTEEPTAGHLGT